MSSLRKFFFNLFNSQRYLEQFSVMEKEKLLSTYRDSIGLTEDLTFGAEAFSNHRNKKVKDHTGFKTQIGDEKENTLENALKGSDDAKDAVKQKFKDIFLGPNKPDSLYSRAKTRYEESIEAFKELVKKVPETYSVEDIRGVLNEVQAKGRTAIEAQHRIEMNGLKEAFDGEKSPTFMASFQNALGIKDLETAKKVKDDLITELGETHKKQLEEFDKSTQENLTLLDKASATEMQHVLFAAQLASWSDQLNDQQKLKMWTEMKRVEDKRRKSSNEPTKALYNVANKTISAINPNDLNFIISLTGKEIEHNKETRLWTVKLPHRFASPWYYFGFKEEPKVEMLSVAQAIKASGFDKIDMTINFTDPETRKKRAKQAYEAALESGFKDIPERPPAKKVEEITLRDGSGKIIDIEELYSDEPAKLNQLRQTAGKTHEALDKLKVGDRTPKQEKINQMKEAILEGRKITEEQKIKEKQEENELEQLALKK